MKKNNLEKAKVLDLVLLIDYSKESIVSKTLLNNKCGTLTLFAFDIGQGLSEHTAPFDAVVQILEGEAMVYIRGKSNKVRANQMIIMPANIPHALKAKKRFKMLLSMIRS
ncbi:MAG: cupin domain-containing protein [Candidatus Omnitrophota bacterium]